MPTNLVLNNESKTLELLDIDELNLKLENNSNLTLKIANFRSTKSLKITAEVASNSKVSVIFGDFSKGDVDAKILFNLNEEGAEAYWDLASLSTGDSKKTFDVSFIHNVGHTKGIMNNYGVSKDNSEIVFSGVNHIKANASKSETRQNAKIIVFDKESKGHAFPILKIDNNDVIASHGAVVGQLSDEHMFYLMSRGLTQEEAKNIITLGYLSPISKHFSEDVQNKILSRIEEEI